MCCMACMHTLTQLLRTCLKLWKQRWENIQAGPRFQTGRYSVFSPLTAVRSREAPAHTQCTCVTCVLGYSRGPAWYRGLVHLPQTQLSPCLSAAPSSSMAPHCPPRSSPGALPCHSSLRFSSGIPHSTGPQEPKETSVLSSQPAREAPPKRPGLPGRFRGWGPTAV